MSEAADELYTKPASIAKAIELFLRVRPEVATAEGDHRYDAVLSDLGEAATAVYVRALLDAHGLVAEPEPAGFGERDRQLLLAKVEDELFRMTRLREHATNPLFHLDLASRSLEELVAKPFAPAPERAAAALARARALPEFFRNMLDVLDRPPAIMVSKTIELAAGLAGFVDNLPREFEAQGVLGSELAALGEACVEAAQAVRRAAVELQDSVLPKSNPGFALGERLFLARLAHQEALAVDLGWLEALVEEEGRRLAASLERAVSTAGASSASEAFDGLARDRLTADSLLPAARVELARLAAFTRARDLMTIPEPDRCEVREMPSYAWGFAALNPPGTLETADVPSLYYVAAVRADWTPERQREHLEAFSRPVLAIVSGHEAYPGHHVQLLHLRRARSRVRRLVTSTAFVEGWAHYAEELLIEEGYAEGDPALELAMIKEALLRLARFKAALGLHVHGWTLAEAQTMFQRQAHLPASWAHEEAVRGTFDPLYLVYSLGKVLIRRLREELRGAPGFSLKTFHDAVLAEGAPTLPVLREALLERFLPPRER